MTPNIKENTNLLFSVNSTNATYAVLKYNADHIELLNYTVIGQKEMNIPDIKKIHDEECNLLVIVANHNMATGAGKIYSESSHPGKNEEITLSVQKTIGRNVSGISIWLDDLEADNIVHHENHDETKKHSHSTLYVTDDDESFTYANREFNQSYIKTTATGSQDNQTINVYFSEDFSEIINLYAESTVVTSPDDDVRRITFIRNLRCGHIKLDQATGLYKAEGSEVCEKITRIDHSQAGNHVSTWEIVDKNAVNCIEETKLLIEIY